MKTFKKFIDEAYIKSKESGDFKVKKSSNTFLNENRLTNPLDVMIIRQGGKETRIPTNPPRSFPVDLARPDLNNPSSRPKGSQRPLPTSSRRTQAARQGVEYARERLDRSRRLNSARAMARTDSTIGRTGRSFAAARELKGLTGLGGRALALYGVYQQGKEVFNPKDNLITGVQNLGTALGNRGVPISRQMKYKGSDPSAVALNRKIDTANKYENEKLRANLRSTKKDVISDVGGVNNRVSTNTKYNAKIGGVEGTSIRGKGGQRMLRANLGAKSAKDKPSFNLFNTKTWGSPKVGTRYAATLGGHKGTVTYDSKGNRKFEALARPKK